MDAWLQVPFQLEGDHGMISYIKKVLDQRGHAVVCLAEGAGQVSAVHISMCAAQAAPEHLDAACHASLGHNSPRSVPMKL